MDLLANLLLYEPERAREQLSAFLGNPQHPILALCGEDHAYVFQEGHRPGPFRSTKVADLLLNRGIIHLIDGDGNRVETKLKITHRLSTIIEGIIHDLPIRDVCVVGSPQFIKSNGKLELLQPGYSPILKTIQLCRQGIAGDEPDPSYPRLKEWMSALSVAHETQRATLLGWALASLCRAHIDRFPALGITGMKSLGKSRLTEALSVFLTGKVQATLTFSGREAEMEARVGSFTGTPGPILILVDNIRFSNGYHATTQINSQLISSATCATNPTVRKLYAGSVPLNMPLFVLNTVGMVVEGDLRDKIFTVRLLPPVGHVPGDPVYLKIDPLEYVRKHRFALLREAQHLLTSIDLTRMEAPRTRFLEWEVIVSRCLDKLGMPYDFHYRAQEAVDGTILELSNVLNSGLDIPATEVVKLTRDMHTPELNAVMRSFREPTDEGRAQAFLAWCSDNLVGKYVVKGQTVRFVIKETSLKKEIVT